MSFYMLYMASNAEENVHLINIVIIVILRKNMYLFKIELPAARDYRQPENPEARDLRFWSLDRYERRTKKY